MNNAGQPRALRAALVLFAALLATSLAWDGGPGALEAAGRLLRGPGQDSWLQVQANSTIRFGVDSNDWPLAAVDGQGHYIGLHPDLGRALAEALGLQAEFVPVGYDGAYDALRLRQCDVLMGALENDPARRADFVYSGTYFDAGQVIVVPGGSPVCRPADLAGRRLAVELGSEADAAARRLARRTAGLRLVTCDSAQLALQAVQSQQADAMLADAVWARQALSRQAGLRILAAALQPYPLALAVRADSPRLQAALNQALAELGANGALQMLLSRWLDTPVSP